MLYLTAQSISPTLYLTTESISLFQKLTMFWSNSLEFPQETPMRFDTMIGHTQITHVLSDDFIDEECQYI